MEMGFGVSLFIAIFTYLKMDLLGVCISVQEEVSGERILFKH